MNLGNKTTHRTTEVVNEEFVPTRRRSEAGRLLTVDELIYEAFNYEERNKINFNYICYILLALAQKLKLLRREVSVPGKLVNKMAATYANTIGTPSNRAAFVEEVRLKTKLKSSLELQMEAKSKTDGDQEKILRTYMEEQLPDKVHKDTLFIVHTKPGLVRRRASSSYSPTTGYRGNSFVSQNEFMRLLDSISQLKRQLETSEDSDLEKRLLKLEESIKTLSGFLRIAKEKQSGIPLSEHAIMPRKLEVKTSVQILPLITDTESKWIRIRSRSSSPRLSELFSGSAFGRLETIQEEQMLFDSPMLSSTFTFSEMPLQPIHQKRELISKDEEWREWSLPRVVFTTEFKVFAVDEPVVNITHYWLRFCLEQLEDDLVKMFNHKVKELYEQCRHTKQIIKDFDDMLDYDLTSKLMLLPGQLANKYNAVRKIAMQYADGVQQIFDEAEAVGNSLQKDLTEMANDLEDALHVFVEKSQNLKSDMKRINALLECFSALEMEINDLKHSQIYVLNISMKESNELEKNHAAGLGKHLKMFDQQKYHVNIVRKVPILNEKASRSFVEEKLGSKLNIRDFNEMVLIENCIAAEKYYIRELDILEDSIFNTEKKWQRFIDCTFDDIDNKAEKDEVDELYEDIRTHVASLEAKIDLYIESAMHEKPFTCEHQTNNKEILTENCLVCGRSPRISNEQAHKPKRITKYKSIFSYSMSDVSIARTNENILDMSAPPSDELSVVNVQLEDERCFPGAKPPHPIDSRYKICVVKECLCDDGEAESETSTYVKWKKRNENASLNIIGKPCNIFESEPF